MLTTFSLFYPGVMPAIDTIGGSAPSESRNAPNGLAFGGGKNPHAFDHRNGHALTSQRGGK